MVRALSRRFPSSLLLVGALAIGVAPSVPSGAASPHATGIDWGAAIPLPGLASLEGSASQPPSISQVCVNADRCLAFGTYGATSSSFYLAARSAGVWGSAAEVPGLEGALGSGGAEAGQIQCFTVHLCLVVANAARGTVVEEYDLGTWGAAHRLHGGVAATPGTPLPAVPSCSSPGNCVVGGSFESGRRAHAFLDDEVRGTWMPEREVPGMRTLEGAHGSSDLTTVDCSGNGSCVAVGWYANATGSSTLPFVVSETAGRWGAAARLPWVDEHALGHDALLSQIACPSTGRCTLAGWVLTATDRFQYVVVLERAGRWQTPILVGRPSTTGSAQPTVALQCPRPAECTLVGQRDATVGVETFAVDLHDGVAGAPVDVDDLQAWLAGPGVLSCPAVGDCGLALGYTSDQTETATASELGGTWTPATAASEFPSSGGSVSVTGVDCLSVTYCTASGVLSTASATSAFVSH